MNSICRQALAVALSGALVGLPLFASSPRSLVGMAQGSGAIQVNGEPFAGSGSLFNGDRIRTGRAAPLTVVSSSAERFRFEPNSSGRVAKQDQGTLIELARGAVEFRTIGATSAELPGGITVRPTSRKTTDAVVNRLADGNAKISVYKGAVEIAAANEKATVMAGHTALVRLVSAQNSNQNNNHKKKAWAIFISTGLAAGAAAAVLANEQSHPVSAVDP